MKSNAIASAAVLTLAAVAAGQSAPSATAPATRPVSFARADIGPAPIERIDPTYQWSIPIPNPVTDRRAYLWISPQCKRVKGVVVGLQNMLEKLMFQNADFRDACAAADLSILYIAPGAIGKDNDPALAMSFKDPKAAAAQLDQLLADFAAMSGYGELAEAPLVPVSHSAATPFGWGYQWTNPKRCIAFLPYKGWFQNASATVPILHVSSEWAEVGDANWGTTWQKNDRGAVLKLRATRENPMLGEYAEIGNGHYAWQPDSALILGLFLKKAVALRVPDDTAADGTTTLRPLPIESGVLVDPDTLGRSNFKAYAYNTYPGEKTAAYWYIDAEMAQAVNDAMAAKLAKKPQVMDALINGQPAPLAKRGVADLRPKFEADGVSFKLAACFLDVAPPNLRYGDQPLGHASGAAFFRVGSGALKQTGPDTFKVWLGRGGIERQGNPWDPWIIAVHSGDADYRGADRPIHIGIDIRRKDGQPQMISFPPVEPAKADAPSIPLAATASSGLPVQYFIVSGPAEVDDATGSLRLLPIPPRAKLPIKITVGAFQWGRGIDPKIASAEPVFQDIEVSEASRLSK